MLIFLRNGRVIAQGPTEAVLTPDTVRALYGVDADVRRPSDRRPPRLSRRLRVCRDAADPHAADSTMSGFGLVLAATLLTGPR